MVRRLLVLPTRQPTICSFGFQSRPFRAARIPLETGNAMITHSQTNGAHTITMDDGKVNALNTDKLEALIAALAAADDQSPVVIKGRKGIWSAGFDLNGFAAGADAATAQLEAGRQAILAILKHPAPVIT